MSLIPSSRPKLSKAEVELILKKKGVDRKKYPVCVLAVRGYYLNSMGKAGVNDRGIYDDAAFVDSPTLFSSVNWNTDPTSYRKGKGTGSSKGMASLKEGVWEYKIGKHKGRGPAGNQAEAVTVIRDGLEGDYPNTGWFGINLHWGGRGTSSLGCQTAPPNQWDSFINPLVSELKRYAQKTFKYVLISESERKALLSETAESAPVSDVGEPTSIDLAPAYSLIREFEGCRLEAYLCPAGVPTIGWGTTRYEDGSRVKLGERISQERAEELLTHEVMMIVDQMQSVLKVKLSSRQFSALVSFTYNLGIGNLSTSTLLKKLNEGKPLGEVAEEFPRWVKAGDVVLRGLVRRREAEKNLFLS